MKYTTEQLKDLILLSEEGCSSRKCTSCEWLRPMKERTFACHFVEENELLYEEKSQIKKIVKEIIREIL